MLEIRQAISSDLTLLAEWTYSLHCHEDDQSIATHPQFKSKLNAWLQSEFESTNGLFLVAQDQQQPIGFIYASTIINDNGFLASPMKGVIHLLWVEKEFRQKKVGERLTKSIETCFKELGVGYVECSFTAINQLAQNFWRKQNYMPYSTTARKIL